MKIYGYSERGMLNALLYEIGHRQNADELFGLLLAEAVFPLANNAPLAGTTTLLIEQSFSQFGDPDAVALIKSPKGNSTIFIEAKVKTYRPRNWHLSTELEKFKKGIAKKISSSKFPSNFSSNLFTQIYYKQQMMSALNESGDISPLEKGVRLPGWPSQQVRKIGKNKIVLCAVKRILQYAQNDFYLMLIPDSSENAEQFFNETLRGNTCIPHSDTSRWGYLTWEKVHAFCKKHRLKNSLEVFDYNKGQIF